MAHRRSSRPPSSSVRTAAAVLAPPSPNHLPRITAGALKAEADRRRYLADPVAFCQERLGDRLWSGQRRILEAVRDHRKTLIPTCHAVGKALALDTPLPTPTGWTTMADVQPGDLLLDEEGQPTTVTAVSPVETRACTRVVFRDGSAIVASDDHQWSALDLTHRKRRVEDWRDRWDDAQTLTTAEMARSATSNGQARWKIPTARPVAGTADWPLSISPYAFGAWLGDGTTVRAEITSHVEDAEFIAEAVGGRIIERSYKPTTRIIRLPGRTYADCPGLESGGKRIPRAVCRCQAATRLELLRGLMDTDGYNASNESRGVGIDLCDADLSSDVYDLVVSLGWVAWRREKPARLNGITVGTCYQLRFTPTVNPFRLPRKATAWDRHCASVGRKQRSKATQRTIAAFEPVEAQLVKCVTVDSPRRLYLAGRAMIPTHNSFTAAGLTAWWIAAHPPGQAFVVTTAPTGPQVRVILWREIGRAYTRGKLPGRVNQTEWIVSLHGKDETVAIGRKPSDYAPDAFQGIHAAFVLVIVDEANGVRGELWDAFDSLIANDGSKIVAQGNPDDPTGEFYAFAKPNSGWHVESIGAFDTPNFTGEPVHQQLAASLISRLYVEDKRLRWAPRWTWSDDGRRCVPPPESSLSETHPFWQSKILGQFPEQSAAGSLIPLSWIRAAQERELPAIGPNELGMDVGASEDGDPTCLGHRRGPVFRVLWEQREPDTMKTTGRLIQDLRNPAYGATTAKVDYIGVGRGVVDRSREQHLPVHPISVGESATRMTCFACRHEWDDNPLTPARRCPKCNSDAFQAVFANLLSQLWWGVREMFEHGEIDLDATDEALAEELLMVRWEPNSKGQTKVFYADGPSPNRADALMIAYAPIPKPAPKFSAVWGRG